MKAKSTNTLATLAVVLFAGTALFSGCQVQVAGQTLPSGYYYDDDIQYFPKGSEMKVQKEADAMKAYKNAMDLR